MKPRSTPAEGLQLSPTAGAVCGLLAAVGYALSNAALREAVETDPIFVSAMKAVPTVIACAPLLVMLSLRGQSWTTSWRRLPLLLAGSLAGQLAGNLLFQISLGMIGLALSVPICLSVMIVGGALLGKGILGDRVSHRMVVAMVILVGATFVLSFGNPAAELGRGGSFGTTSLGVVASAVSGIAYAFYSVSMRSALRDGFTVPLTMITSGLVGCCFLWPIAFARLGSTAIASTATDQWWAMVIAGVLNMAAFFMLSLALRAITVLSVNLLNATQTGLAAILGVYWFGEQVTTPLLVGLFLTIAGLLVLGTGGRGETLKRPQTDPHKEPIPAAPISAASISAAPGSEQKAS